VALYYFKDKLS